MSANVETMFSVREVPWHGLGTIVETAPNSKEAIKLAGLDWRVKSVPIYDQTRREINGFKANMRDSDNSILGIVSDKYKIVQNEEAFEFTDSLINDNDDILYETAGSLKNGKTVWLLAKLPKKDILGDDFDPYICFTNSHDGKGAIIACMTPIRVVCNNTLNLALNSTKRMWTSKHMGDMQSKLAEARHTLNLANAYMDSLGVEADRLSKVKITDAEIEAIIDELYPVDKDDTERKKNNVLNLKESIFKCYNMSDISQFKGTAWGVINAVTDFADHAAPARVTKNFKENNWGRIIGGHPIVDNFYKKVA